MKSIGSFTATGGTIGIFTAKDSWYKFQVDYTIIFIS